MFDTYAQIFEKRAAEYHHAMGQCPKARDAEFLAVVEPLRDALTGLVCDMPSGGGYLADYLWNGLKYLAVDPAPDFFVGWSKPHQRLQAEITDVPLTEQSVDYIVSLAGLHHEPSLPCVFAEMRRLLVTGGRVVIADVAVDTPPARFLNGFVAEHCPLGHDGRFLDGQTAPALEAAGFQVAMDTMVEVPWSFESLDEAGDFCRNLFGMTSLNIDETADAMGREIGFDLANGVPRLRWMLRRIVADAI